MKKVTGTIKLQCEAGKANPAPPIGPALGAKGVNIMEFCKQFNAKTQKDQGMIIPVIITVYQDRSFSFELKTPPASFMIMKAIGLQKGSSVPNKDKVSKITKAQVREIAETKLKDMNAYTVEAAMNSIEGTAKSMGVDVVD